MDVKAEDGTDAEEEGTVGRVARDGEQGKRKLGTEP